MQVDIIVLEQILFKDLKHRRVNEDIDAHHKVQLLKPAQETSKIGPSKVYVSPVLLASTALPMEVASLMSKLLVTPPPLLMELLSLIIVPTM